MARSWECRDHYAQKVFDTADIVREAIFQQLGPSFENATTVLILKPQSALYA
jgi:hypothetical protein